MVSGLWDRPRARREITILERQGKIALDRDPLTWIQALFQLDRIEAATLSPSAAGWAGQIDAARFPGDPIDRLLYATAMDLRVPFVTKDERVTEFADATGGVEIVW